jgi:NAD(P)-dependent dehydrogenase (short-subunit alcohol dehydrogenase family)
MGEAMCADRVAIVTGDTRGAGWAITESIATQGIYVAAGYSTTESAAMVAKENADAASCSVSVHQGNVGIPEDCSRVVDDVISSYRHVDFLMNNAGVTVDRSPDDGRARRPRSAGDGAALLSSIDLILPHQANKTMVVELAETVSMGRRPSLVQHRVGGQRLFCQHSAGHLRRRPGRGHLPAPDHLRAVAGSVLTVDPAVVVSDAAPQSCP